MRSHSFQDTELKLHRYVNGSPGQVVGGDRRFYGTPWGSEIEG